MHPANGRKNNRYSYNQRDSVIQQNLNRRRIRRRLVARNRCPPPPDRSDHGYMWTEHFKILWDNIVHNSAYDPDDSTSDRYIISMEHCPNSRRKHGDDYMSAGAMQRRYMGAKQGKEPTAKESKKRSGLERRIGFLKAKVNR